MVQRRTSATRPIGTNRVRRRAAWSLLALSGLFGLASCGSDSAGADGADGAVVETVTVLHPAPPAPTLIDAAPAGPSVGDVRIFHYPARTESGEEVGADWVMTTTAMDSPSQGVETRVATAVFHFGAGTDDELLLEGVALYPGESATLKEATTIHRALIGGSGKYAGATGDVVSTHLPDGSWKHVFRIQR